jgi:signal transduction histidine kinase
MSGISSKLRKHRLEIVWATFAAANLAVIFALDEWQTVPFHFIWVSLTLVYGLRVWGVTTTWAVLAGVTIGTGAALTYSVARGPNGRPDELTEVPLMAAMFVAMVWHARRQRAASAEVRTLARQQHRILQREREFVRDASHEIRTPITVARGHAELIRADHAGEQSASDADTILEELDRLSRISERLLILAAAEGPTFLRRRPVDVGSLVETTVRRWRATAPRDWRSDVQVTGVLAADPDRMVIALDALIENAVRFTSDGDSVTVSARAVRGVAMIEVSDTGDGIPSDHHDRIFERFARVDVGRNRLAGGTGLGLAIVRAIVEAHEGSVAVSSAPGRGSTFTIRLPYFEPLIDLTSARSGATASRARSPLIDVASDSEATSAPDRSRR